jgi:hypothetical protein
MGSVPFRIGPTPNPNAVRVGLGRAMFPGPLSFSSAAEAQGQPLARALLEIPGVRSVFCLNDFISITKDPGVEWSALEPRVTDALTRHLRD